MLGNPLRVLVFLLTLSESSIGVVIHSSAERGSADPLFGRASLLRYTWVGSDFDEGVNWNPSGEKKKNKKKKPQTERPDASEDAKKTLAFSWTTVLMENMRSVICAILLLLIAVLGFLFYLLCGCSCYVRGEEKVGGAGYERELAADTQ